MAIIQIYVKDTEYIQWLKLPKEKQTAIKTQFKNNITKTQQEAKE